MTRHCEALGCNAEIEPGKLMCLRHWRMLPQENKDDVGRTFARYRRTPSDLTIARNYQNAVRDAIKAVEDIQYGEDHDD